MADDVAASVRAYRARVDAGIAQAAEHHDGFPMYDCGFSRWNAAAMGPKRDVIGELAAAVRAQSMVFGLSSHRAEHWFFQHGGTEFPSDVSDPANADLYGPAMPSSMPPNDEFLENWLVRTAELVDKCEPALVWFDWWIENEVFAPYLRQFAAYYYNRASEWKRQVAINYKFDAVPLAWPESGSVTISSLALGRPLAREIGSVRSLGHDAELANSLTEAGLTVRMPDGSGRMRCRQPYGWPRAFPKGSSRTPRPRVRRRDCRRSRDSGPGDDNREIAVRAIKSTRREFRDCFLPHHPDGADHALPVQVRIRPDFVDDRETSPTKELMKSVPGDDLVVNDSIWRMSRLAGLWVMVGNSLVQNMRPERKKPGEIRVHRVTIRNSQDQETAGLERRDHTIQHSFGAADVFENER